MSIYGGIARVDNNNSFRFDKVYSSRKEMETNSATDGIFAGRYVLVQYGIRYEGASTEQATTIWEDTGVPYQKTTKEYKENAQLDIKAYGAIFDSTVWQKVFQQEIANGNLKTVEKYILVANLNAIAPEIEVVVDAPYTYKEKTSDDEKEVVNTYVTADGDLRLLQNSVEEINVPHFDKTTEGESTYKFHMPKMVMLDVSDGVDYNQEGFNMFIGADKKNKASAISWEPVFQQNTPPVRIQNGAYQIDNNKKRSERQVDTKKLNMNLTAFGDVLIDLYNVLYGEAKAGEMRPYFSELGMTKDDISNADTGVGKIESPISNNKDGLATLLKRLLTTSDVDPFTGKVTLRFLTDWAGYSNTNNTTNPLISNKPMALVKVNKDKDDNIYTNNDAGELVTDPYCYINYTSWSIMNKN